VGDFCLVKLIVQGIECYYNSVKVLDNVSFTVSGGSFFGVIGPNGSGKTTLLRTISGVLRPKIGSVLIDNQEIHTLKKVEVAKKVGVVPQNPSSTLNFTVLDVVLMGRNPYLGRMESEDADDLSIAEWAMKLTSTLHLADRHIDELSGGERQRVIIARALAQRPKVLLLDEPTLHLDINHQLEIMELLRRLCSEQKLAVIAVLHDFNLAARYCDSLAIMSQGRITAIGPCERVLTSRNIEEAFGVRVVIKRHPVTGFLYATPLSKGGKNHPTRKFKVHLICGGGSGGYLMRELVEEVFRLTAGVLNVIDSDYETAEALGVPAICEAPFSPITDENHQENLKMIMAADIVLIADMPFGYMNLKNLEAALEAQKAGKRIVIVAGQPSRSRDYTGGRAKAILERLKEQGAIVVKNGKEAIKIVKSLER